MQEWKLYNDHKYMYVCSKKFNGFIYSVIIDIEDLRKSVRFWVGVTSGKKRSELTKPDLHRKHKSMGGMEALIWAKETMLEFPKYYRKHYFADELDLFLCVQWADNRRRDIYSRLQKEGFKFMMIDGEKTLTKKYKRITEQSK